MIVHFDPLRLVKLTDMDGFGRHEFYKRLTLGSEAATTVGYLSETEVKQVTEFLKTLSF